MKKYKNGKLIFIKKIIIWTLLLCCVTQGLKTTGPQQTGENRKTGTTLRIHFAIPQIVPVHLSSGFIDKEKKEP